MRVARIVPWVLLVVAGCGGGAASQPAEPTPGPTAETGGETPPAEPPPPPDEVQPATRTGTQLALGNRHTCALIADGTVRCWGTALGALGLGAVGRAAVPTAVPGLANVVQIAAGGEHTCVIGADGSVWCAGSNQAGQLGLGAVEAQLEFAQVPGLTGARRIDAGFLHTCAIRADGTAWCWGATIGFGADTDETCRIGSDETPCVRRPVQIEAIQHARAVAVGRTHTCFLVEGGAVWCGGTDARGELGDGAEDAERAFELVNGIEGATQIAAGDEFSCALLADATVKCWGRGTGFGRSGDELTPVAVDGLAGITFVYGGEVLCAIGADAKAKCLAPPPPAAPRAGAPRPATIAGPTVANGRGEAADASTVLNAQQHSCITTSAGEVRCWGSNADGQLGDPWATRRTSPVRILAASGAPIPATDRVVAGSPDIAIDPGTNLTTYDLEDLFLDGLEPSAASATVLDGLPAAIRAGIAGSAETLRACLPGPEGTRPAARAVAHLALDGRGGITAGAPGLRIDGVRGSPVTCVDAALRAVRFPVTGTRLRVNVGLVNGPRPPPPAEPAAAPPAAR